MSSATYTVAGMTCNGCVTKVTKAVSAIDGVEDIDVDVSTGALEVVGDVDATVVEAAINEIGYQAVRRAILPTYPRPRDRDGRFLSRVETKAAELRSELAAANNITLEQAIEANRGRG